MKKGREGGPAARIASNRMAEFDSYAISAPTLYSDTVAGNVAWACPLALYSLATAWAVLVRRAAA